MVAALADRIAVMYAGRLVEIGPSDELFDGASHPYTRRLLHAIPVLTGRRTLEGIPGFAPRPGRRPPGCSFAPRCAYAVEQCSADVAARGRGRRACTACAAGATKRCAPQAPALAKEDTSKPESARPRRVS